MSLLSETVNLWMPLQRRLRRTSSPTYVCCASFKELMIMYCRKSPIGPLFSNTSGIFYYDAIVTSDKRTCKSLWLESNRDQLHQTIWKANVRKCTSSKAIWGWLILSSLFNRVMVIQWKLLCHRSIIIRGLGSRIPSEKCQWVAILLTPHTQLWMVSTSQTSGYISSALFF